MGMPSLAAVRKLVPLNPTSVVLTPEGEEWFKNGVLVNRDRLERAYGVILPKPTLAVEDDDKTLCAFWECNDEPVVVRFNPEMWNFS